MTLTRKEKHPPSIHYSQHIPGVTLWWSGGIILACPLFPKCTLSPLTQASRVPRLTNRLCRSYGIGTEMTQWRTKATTEVFFWSQCLCVRSTTKITRKWWCGTTVFSTIASEQGVPGFGPAVGHFRYNVELTVGFGGSFSAPLGTERWSSNLTYKRLRTPVQSKFVVRECICFVLFCCGEMDAQ